MFEKVEDFLTLGVTAVIVVDPDMKSVFVLRRDQDQQTFAEADTLVVPDVLPAFAVPVANLFAGALRIGGGHSPDVRTGRRGVADDKLPAGVWVEGARSFDRG